MEPMKPMETMKPMDAGPKWWPEDLGELGTSGSQNDVRYVFFPQSHRLAIQQDGKLALYDSGDHQISGVSQQQGGGQSLAACRTRFSGRARERKKPSTGRLPTAWVC
jgi:hypothetical protein